MKATIITAAVLITATVYACLIAAALAGSV